MIKSSVHASGRLDCISILKPAIFFSLLFFTVFAKAQLSGTYTICTSSCSYSSIGAAVTDLASKGISGAVTFNVSAGTYAEYITIPSITGASAKNTISFKGAGRGKTILKGSSGSNVLYLNGAAYISFDGFTIQNTSSSGYSFYPNGALNCSILNSNIIAATGSSSNYNIYSVNTNYLTVSNCYVFGGYYGFYFNGSGGSSSAPIGNLNFTNNRIVSFGYIGAYILSSGGNTAVNNVFSGNVIDSSYNNIGYGFLSSYESGAVVKNNRIAATLYYSMYIQYPNYYFSATQAQAVNNIITGYIYYGMYVYMSTSGTNVLIAHNTIYGDSSSKAYGAAYFFNSQTNKGLSVESNIFEGLGSTYNSGAGIITVAGISSGFKVFDGNDVFCPGQTVAYLFGTLYSDIASFKSVMNGYGWEKSGSNLKPVYISPLSNLHLNQSKLAPNGIYAGIDVDFDGDSRCKLFPTAGADESTYGKGKPTVMFYLPSVTYPNSPATVFQTGKSGEPKLYQWYLNGVLISDSVTLYTSLFKVGVNTLKLVTISCSGKDSFQTNDTVSAPGAVPVVDFLASANKISTGDVVSFTDISSNGPVSWQWTITPAYSYSSGVQLPSYSFSAGSANSPNPKIKFLAGGKYKVCLTTANGVGSGKSNCKTDYITVLPAINIGSVSTIHDSSGYLFDDGGPNAPYKTNGNPSVLIDPCADSVYLVFNSFDLYCGQGFINIYEGKDHFGKLLGTCSSGYTGGPTYSGCALKCIPNTTASGKADTFKAKNTMFIQMNNNNPLGAAGFSATWWSKPKNSKPATAAFTSSDAGDSVCVNHSLTFINTSKTDPNDPPTYLWDLDGDMSSFECIGTCVSAIQPYYLNGKVKVTLIAINCGGTDTASRNITVYYPFSPKTDFTVDNTAPTTNEVAFLNPVIAVCVDDYQWTITKSSGSGTGTATYVKSTTLNSANPQVMFSDTGFYDVKLYADNFSGNNSISKTRYIHVRKPYCIPTVTGLIPDLGITRVIFNTINNTTKPATTDYRNFVNTPSLATTVELGLSYNLTVKRDSPAYNTIIRSVYIDWNQDGVFGASERVAVDSGSMSIAWNTKIKIPSNAKTGATVMRIAVNNGSYTNYPCGQNQVGEYQDYRLYVTPYHTLPVISLKGKNGLTDTIFVENGHSYIEDGYSANSLMDGDITSKVVVTNAAVTGFPYPGALLYSYNVQDSAGLKAKTQYRVVRFLNDTTPPDLVVDGPVTTDDEVFYPVHLPKVLSVSDLVTKKVMVYIDTTALNIKKLGMYQITYVATDSMGNTTTVIRYVKVIDTIAPVLVLKGNATDTIGVNTSYKDSGVSVSDNYYDKKTLDSFLTITTNLDTSTYGVFTIYYNLTDPSGNIAKTITRTVVIKDKAPPVVHLKGFAVDSMEVMTTYNDIGYTVTDNLDNPSQIKVVKSGSFYTAFPSGYADSTGLFSIIYIASDRAGNIGTATRMVKVQDRQAPVITLIGSPVASICRWYKYIDAGYTLTDNYDKSYNIKVDSTGTFYTKGGTTVEGLYSIQYIATDRAGNSVKSDSRAVQVLSINDVACKSGISETTNPDNYISIFPNPNSGIFTINIDPAFIDRFPLKMTITSMLGQQIKEIQNGPMLSNNIKIDLSNKPAGVYFLNIIAGNQVVTKRIEITK